MCKTVNTVIVVNVQLCGYYHRFRRAIVYYVVIIPNIWLYKHRHSFTQTILWTSSWVRTYNCINIVVVLNVNLRFINFRRFKRLIVYQNRHSLSVRLLCIITLWHVQHCALSRHRCKRAILCITSSSFEKNKSCKHIFVLIVKIHRQYFKRTNIVIP